MAVRVAVALPHRLHPLVVHQYLAAQVAQVARL
jgi:hypothetical protein